jgi:hypothetical protein
MHHHHHQAVITSSFFHHCMKSHFVKVILITDGLMIIITYMITSCRKPPWRFSPLVQGRAKPNSLG